MKQEKIHDALDYLDDDMIETVGALRRKKKQTKRSLVKWGAMAACLCLLVAGAFIWKQSSSTTQSSTRITVSEDGVTIPPMKVTLSSKQAGDMVAFFIYQGRCYVQYEWIYNNLDIVGKYLGTATGLINEWTPRKGYVELAGSVKGDFYSVEGFDPSFMLCMKGDDGSVSTYIDNNGITLKNGSDLFEERIHLAGNYYSLEYQTRNDWYYDKGNPVVLGAEYEDTINRFVEAINSASFMRTEDIPLGEGQTSIYDKEIYHLFFKMNNGMTIQLRLFDGGYVSFQGVIGACVKVQNDRFSELISILDSISQ